MQYAPIPLTEVVMRKLLLILLLIARFALGGTSWNVTYLNGEKVGYGYSTSILEGGLTYIESYNVLQLIQNGMPQTNSSRGEEIYDGEGRLIAAELQKISGLDILFIKAELQDDTLVVARTHGLMTGKRYLEGGLVGGSGLGYLLAGSKPGDSVPLRLYSSEYDEVLEGTYEKGVLSRITLPDGEASFPGYHNRSIYGGTTRDVYLDEDGNWLGTYIPGGIVVRPAADEAAAKADIAWVDATASAAIFPTGELKGNPRAVEELTLTVTALSPPLSGPFQRITELDDGGYSVGINQRSALVEDAPEVAAFEESGVLDKLAASLVVPGDEFNSYAAIVNWVADNLQRQPLGLELTPAEIAERRAGDCSEHATLVTELCHRAGLPAHTVLGLVAGVGGRFYYHAWNEVYVDGLWRQGDAFLDQLTADAARLGLLRDPDSFTRDGVFGQVTAIVIESQAP